MPREGKKLTSEDYEYIFNNYESKATKTIARHIGITQNRLIGILRLHGIYIDTKSHVWTEDEHELLRKLTKAKITPRDIAKEIGVSINEVYWEAHILNIQLYRNNCQWTEDELELLREYAGNYIPSTIAKKLGRSELGVKTKMAELGLKVSLDTSAFHLTIQEFADLMGISRDRVQTFEKLGLATKRVGKGGGVRKVIRINDILPFLESHQDLFDASLVSEDLFAIEPKWLRDKRKKDIQSKDGIKWYVNKESWTTREIRDAVNLRRAGISDEVIARKLNRTVAAIQLKLRENGLAHYESKDWTREEIELLELHYKSKTDLELGKMFNRTESAVRTKRKRLGLRKNARPASPHNEKSA